MQFRLCLLVACFAFLVFLPASVGQAAEVRDLRAYFDQLDSRGGEWNKNSNNDYGLLAFREAYVLQSYLLMYETYQDTCYLDKFVDHADSVLKQRDNIRKVTDYRGLSLPAWRHTDPPNDSNPLILGGKYYHVAVDTGNISYPYAWFARIVKNDPGLSAYNSKATYTFRLLRSHQRSRGRMARIRRGRLLYLQKGSPTGATEWVSRTTRTWAWPGPC